MSRGSGQHCQHGSCASVTTGIPGDSTRFGRLGKGLWTEPAVSAGEKHFVAAFGSGRQGCASTGGNRAETEAE